MATKNTGSGFSLVELLIVITIIGIMMVLAIPASSNLVSAQRITQATQAVVDEVNFCRQTASSKNAMVELCFVQALGENVYSGVASRLIHGDGTVTWQKKIAWFPAGVVLSSDSDFTNLLTVTTSTFAAPFPRTLSNTYISVNIRPNGELNPITGRPTPDQWFVTVVLQRDAQKAGTPKNYAVVQIDPLTARTTVLRP